MARRRIGQETLAFVSSDAGRRCSLDDLHDLIDWAPIDRRLASISCSAKGEPAWPPLALFKAMLLAMWYDLSDVKLAEALDDRASFRRYCGFSGDEATPERTTFVRFRKALIARTWTRRCSTRSPPNSRPRRSGSRQERLSTPPSLPPRAKAMTRRAGSNTKAGRRSMASRRMLAPTPTRLWSRKSQLRPQT